MILWFFFAATTNAAIFGNRLLFNIHFVVMFHKEQGQLLEERFYHLWTRMLKFIHTYSMVQIPSWADNWFAASQEIPLISRNSKFHYLTHKRLSPFPILGQANLVHIPTPYFLEIHPNIIHPSRPRSPQWPPSLRFPHQEPIHSPLLTHTLHMPSP